jgi:MATE family multidrug resistance protein
LLPCLHIGKKYNYFSFFKYSPTIAKSIIKLSIPVSFQNVFILVGFLSFVAITGLIGTTEQASSQVIISALMISMMPCFGFGIAVQTLVGTNFGAKKFKEAKFYGFQTAKIATVYTFIVGVIFLLIPEWILMIVTEESSVIEMAKFSLQIVGVGQILYAVGVVLANSLQAVGESLFVMIGDVLANWVIFVPLAYVIGITFELGLWGAWLALPFYVFVYSVLMFVKFNWGSWQKPK